MNAGSAAAFTPTAKGDLIASLANGQVNEYTPTGAFVQTLIPNANLPTGSAFDGQGNLYVTEFGGNDILKVDAQTGAVSVFSNDSILADGTSFNSPESVAFGPGYTKMYVSDANRFGTGGGIHVIDPATGKGIGFYPLPSSSGSLGSGESDWLAFSSSGTLYMTNENPTQGIMHVDQSTGDIVSPSFVANLPDYGYAMSFDPSSDLWLSDSSRILEYDPSGNLLRTITNPNFNLVFAAVFNPPFNTIYAGDLQTGDIFSYDLSGNLQNTFNVGSGIDGLSVAGTVLPGTGGSPSCSTAIPGTPPPTAAGATVNVAAIEVNQVVQDWCDSVPLIQGKPALVRVHLQNTAATAQSVSVVLQVSRNGTVLGQLPPVNPGNTSASSISVAPSQNPENARDSINSTANFLLPANWESGTVTLTALPAQGQKLGCADPTSQPSACTVQVTFKPSPTFHLTLVQGAYPDPNGSGTCIRADTSVMKEEIKRLYEIFPVAPGHIDSVITIPTSGEFVCLSPASGYSPSNIWGGPMSWKLDAFNQSGLQAAQAAWQAAHQPANRYFVTVLPMGYEAWYGITGASANMPSANTVWYVGHAPPFVDPWAPSSYEIGHELMHAMGITHPGPWIDDSGVVHQPVNGTGLCGEGGSDNIPRPSVAVGASSQYSFTPGIEGHYSQADWKDFGTYPMGRAYSLGPMNEGPDSEIWGLNVDAFLANDLPQRIVVDPHNTFDMMSYCWGTYGPSWQGAASKFQWITTGEYEAVLSKLSGS